MKMMVLMMVEQCKAQDEIFRKTGTENDEFEAALLYHCSTDAAVAKAMQEYMMKMQTEMQRHQ